MQKLKKNKRKNLKNKPQNFLVKQKTKTKFKKIQKIAKIQ